MQIKQVRYIRYPHPETCSYTAEVGFTDDKGAEQCRVYGEVTVGEIVAYHYPMSVRKL